MSTEARPRPPCPTCDRTQALEQKRCCVGCPRYHTMFCDRRHLASLNHSLSRLTLTIDFVHPSSYDPSNDFVYYLSDPLDEDGEPVEVAIHVQKEQWSS